MQFLSLRTSVSRLLFRGPLGHDLTWITAPLDPRKLVSYRWVSKKNKSMLNKILKKNIHREIAKDLLANTSQIGNFMNENYF